MYGDFSRLTFDRRRHDRGVLGFQGRLVLDQDLNKQWQIADYLRGRHTGDIVGPCGAPTLDPGFAISVSGGDLLASAGRFYVHGVLCENEAQVDLTAQPHLPADAPIVRLPDGSDVTLGAAPAGQYFAVLDRWTRLMTPLQEPDLKEIALGGPDTAGAARTIWQVRLVAAGPLGANVNCLSEPPAWQDLVAGPDGTFRARAQPSTNDAGPCVVEAGAGYRRVSNQLYRVEVHQGGPVGTATFKWSRENGSVATTWLGTDGSNLMVESLGRDRATGFAPGDWVELRDDDLALQGLPGTLVRVVTARDNILTVDPLSADGSIDIADFGANPIVRRWDSDGAQTIAVPGGNDGYIPLEDGVEIGFEAGTTYRAGDYVMIPARYETNDIEWPEDPVSGDLLRLPPHGIHHAYCKLALLTNDGGWSLLSDCRDLFPPLTQLVTMDYLGGSGQEAAPDPLNPNTLVPLGAPLQVGVSRGTAPLAGQPVRFSVAQGNGRLTGNVAVATVQTNAAGVASVNWSLDSGTAEQRVVAELLDPASNRRHLPITFSANLSRAEDVSFDPSNCPPLAGSTDVQSAIDTLCQLGQGGCATYVVTEGTDWVALLNSLQPGESAHICFRRGFFGTTGAVELRDLGHITISGCGEGSLIMVNRAERAIEAINCASFTLREIAISAPDGGSALPHFRHLNGTVTATGCRDVEISDTVITCGASARLERSCITVRPDGFDRSARPTPLRSVRIVNNRLVVGYGQIGLLVTDAGRTQIRDNDIAVAPRPNTLTFERLLEDPARRKRMAGRLVRGALIEGRGGAGRAKMLRAGRYTATIRSAVPESEWRKLMADNPPSDAQKATAPAYQRYVEGLIARAAKQPNSLPSYERQLNDLRRAIGDPEFNRLNQAVKTGLLFSGSVQVRSFEEISEEQRSNTLVIDDRRIEFDSPLSNADWAAVARAQPPGSLRSDNDLLRYAKAAAERMVREPAFRNRFPTALAWFDRLRLNNPSAGYQGIVCGGRTLTNAEVSGNRVTGFLEGIHIGLSHVGATSQQFDQAGMITVENNSLYLRVPIDRQGGRYGLFVGNARRVRIAGNTLTFANALPDPDRDFYHEGIRVWGHLGPFMIVKENYIALGDGTGILVRHADTLPTRQSVQWLAADNMAEGVGPTKVVDAPTTVTRRNNKPA
ncbi:DUF6519 domain-containing protein [Pelagibius sp.]|uniref:DUF6519 domain-containing protein n=1 Tax=Pelagibius sp. TaxID=1931238 RepID=UPI00262568C9|nr:DUF6519 domain-containing protein [Pelagibius sp.]